MAKYTLLFQHLCSEPDRPVTMTFAEIELLVGPLPASATKYAAWWSNDASGGTQVQSRSWLDAGREVEAVDRAHHTVRFGIARWRRGS